MGFHLFIIVFLLFLALLILGAKNNGSRKVLYLTLSFLVLYFISAFRSSSIGNDTGSYINIYNLVGNSSSYIAYNSGFEAGYVFLNRILFHITNNWFILLAVTSAIILGLEMIFIYRNSNNLWMSIFLFINLRMFYFTLSGIRQSIAIAIVLYSSRFIKERKLLLYIVFILIASLFHTSAVGMVILYPLVRFKFSKNTIFIGITIMLLTYLFFERYMMLVVNLFPRYGNYLDPKYLNADTKLASVMEFLVMLFIFIFIYFIVLHSKAKKSNLLETNFMLQITFTGVLVSFLALKTIMLDRYVLYFTGFMVVFLPNAIEHITDKKLKNLVVYIVLILFLTYNFTILYFKPDWNHLYPYEFNF